jgi:hypothetical protein
MKFRSLISSALAIGVLTAIPLFADDPRPTVSPGVGNAVLLAKNSIQLDQGVTVNTGDVIVNDNTSGAVYGEKALSLDKNVHTPAGFKIAATSIDLDQGAVAGGDAYYNTLVNQGTISGSQVSPLALPVFSSLPPMFVRPAGPDNVTVPINGTVDLAEGAYGNLVVNRGGTVRFTGGGYSFASISADRDVQLRFLAPSDVVVTGRIAVGRNAIVGPATTSGITAASIRIQASGINGTDGALHSEPSAIDVGSSSKISANVQAGNGSIELADGNVVEGSLFARDILVGRDGQFTLRSNLNQAPTANSQTVFTTGTSPLTITLTGSDPEGSALTFSIVSGPSAGSLSSVTQVTPTSANVTYTPATAGAPDSFTFRVRDASGATGDAVVSINPTGDDPPPADPTTVIATDSSAETAQNISATLLLRGTAPSGVSLTFSIVSGTGPSHGSLGPVTQGTGSPVRDATVVYTPDSGYTGSDAFQFRACGTIGTSTVCDDASFNLNVGGVPPDPSGTNLVSDVEVTTFADEEVTISLGSETESFSRHIVLTPHAAVLQPAAIAGNVADADNNGFGDNHNALPGSAPGLMSAGVGQSGGAGSNGTTRIEIEFDISQFAGSADALQSASVTLPTNRGTTDSVDTRFYWVTAEGDGALSDSDFEGAGEQIPGATMPVPSGMGIGSDGTFTFGVLDQVRTAMRLGRNYFVVQGRVDESQGGSVRGLQVRTTAAGNQPSDVPGLALATPGVSPPLVYTITSLPSFGILFDGLTQITSAPYTLSGASVRYVPNNGFIGQDTFGFQATNNTFIDAATARVNVRFSQCAQDVSACFNGR